MAMKEKDKKFLEEMEGMYSFHHSGGVNRYGIPKTGSRHDGCISGMANAVGQMQGYLLALREYGIISSDEWKEQMEEYVYHK